ncbi:DUF7000 family protein [Thalassotalea marina]|uniref:DUF7000 domain-containing protein n=1 Tax=Thalassotalea marina TaxID=1673741 RepID=A0A919EMX5_9GAMM|nr:hypothetical protein [Thalassotalea marina]GHG05028.1 hypothetical protein GCM10017161_38120 [Thalassotalea marina]
MSGSSLNKLIPAYKEVLADGHFQQTYQRLVGIVQKLRTEFNNQYKNEYSVANILHGYVDYTYFYLQNDFLKHRKLKLAIVLNHQQVQFELWLLGQTKPIQINYWQKLQGHKWISEVMPEYSVIEIPLLEQPDFDQEEKLSASIHQNFTALSSQIFDTLKSLD